MTHTYNQMHYIVYLSSSVHKLTEEQLQEILVKSRENNQKKGITGLLIYMDGSIIQILEGEKEKVMPLYKTIGQDPRHRGIIRLKEGDLEERLFPDWSMGYHSISPDEARELTGFKSTGDVDFYNFLGEKEQHPALTVFRAFVKNNRI
ncbi:BLUF domain-containing protein [Litoribacter alkaliphilus]|uniref:BLUF domain-containing protein n=1 Tax=Litoribacter ruber TaxID=702568 RepID=A0AAP2CHT4_9BACT|nr:BLUF domain-containing protein [Litoribacter alkaliphilus]MBS9523889.1 BLUF domain-containing protein [Litoribacter alkaliphilus]